MLIVLVLFQWVMKFWNGVVGNNSVCLFLWLKLVVLIVCLFIIITIKKLLLYWVDRKNWLEYSSNDDSIFLEGLNMLEVGI